MTHATEQAPRNLTPAELATLVRAFRDMRSWSQEQLAEIARLTTRTVQRVEDGEPSSVDTRRALAAAFGFEDIDAFNKPYVIPTPEEAAAAKERFDKDHVTQFTFLGRPLNSANTKAWQAALQRAGIEDFRWHDLRHTWATRQRQAGTPTHELQRLGGWRTASMVERYAHLAPDYLIAAASRLDSVLPIYDPATEPPKEKRPALLRAA